MTRFAMVVIAAALAGCATSAEPEPATNAEPATSAVEDPLAACAPDGEVVSTGNSCPTQCQDTRVLAICCSRKAVIACASAGDVGTITCGTDVPGWPGCPR